MKWEGVLPLYKPKGITSHDAVNQLRKTLRIKRIGHTGTLDPDVSGVLPLCLGRATRIVEYLQDLPKEYEAEVTIGFATDTEDLSGHIVEKAQGVHLSAEQVKQTFARFVGTMEQVPPMYSAVRVGGKRLYELARSGLTVERRPRTITIHRIDILRMELLHPFPKISFRVLCSKGTYIRTLCVDLGRALGYPAVMSGLIRTASGNIRIEHCLTMEQVEERVSGGNLEEKIIPLDEALDHLQAYHVEKDTAQRALQGQPVPFSLLRPAPENGAERIRLYGENRQFLGIFSLDPRMEEARPEKIFPPQS